MIITSLVGILLIAQATKAAPSQNYNDNTKFILLWNPVWGNSDWSLGTNQVGSSFFEKLNCPVTDCVITSNKSILPVEEFDAILFYGTQVDYLPRPDKRKESQLYVISMSIPTVFLKVEPDPGFYNLTMTYRLNSDILWSYRKILDKETGELVAPNYNPNWMEVDNDFYDEKLINLTKSKSKGIAWITEWCLEESRNSELAVELKKYFDFDIYGLCGNKTCPNPYSCNELLEKNYKFYASFENSLCEDFVSDRFYHFSELLIIPIVYGGADYNRFAPPKSYINANDFKNAEELATHLKFLSDNPEEYIKYFWWKNYYRMYRPRSEFCSLCEKLHDENYIGESRKYDDISKWWFDGNCKKFPEISLDPNNYVLQ